VRTAPANIAPNQMMLCLLRSAEIWGHVSLMQIAMIQTMFILSSCVLVPSLVKKALVSRDVVPLVLIDEFFLKACSKEKKTVNIYCDFPSNFDRVWGGKEG